MINWMFFPKNKRLDNVSSLVVQAFEKVSDNIDSSNHHLKSDDVLAIVKPQLKECCFVVEESKKADDLVSIPVLFGVNGRIEKSFEADAYLKSAEYVIEVEAGRAVVNYQFLKDFFEACTMAEVKTLCIAVRNTYKNSNDFQKVCTFFEAMYASNRLGIPLSGILVVGY